MLSLRFLSVRDVPHAPVHEERMACSIQVQGGSSRCVHLDRGPHQREGNQQDVPVPTGAPGEHLGEATISPLWHEEVEVDSEGQETVEIALHFAALTEADGRKTAWHLVTTIEVEEFRLKPDQTFTLWKSLRPATTSGQNDSHNFGAIQISVTYAVDYVEEGYWFAFFCGLLPVSLILLWTDNNTKRIILAP